MMYAMRVALRFRKSAPGIVRLVLAALVGLSAPNAARAQTAALEIERTIKLKGVSGALDHMAVDLGRKRLFVAEVGNGTVDVLDIATGVLVRRIGGFKGPQSVGYAGGADALAVASAGDGSVRLFRGTELQPAGTINLGQDADIVRLDPKTGNFIIGYGSGGLAVIDPVTDSLVSRILLKDHPEDFQLDSDNRRAFVNVPDAHQIAVVDMDTGRQSGVWQVPEKLRSNIPMALDAAHSTAAVVFRSPSRLVFFDVNTGKPNGDFKTCGDADDVFFDERRRRVYVSCGAGRVDAWQQDASGYSRLASVKTAPGARTSLFVPDLDRLYVAAGEGFFGLGSNAAILVLRPVD